MAAYSGNSRILGLLLENSANPNSQVSMLGHEIFVLRKAAAHGNTGSPALCRTRMG